MERLSGGLAQLKYIPQTLGLMWACASTWMSLWAVLLVVQGLLPIATVYLTKLLVDSLVISVASDGSWETMRTTLVLVGLMAALMLLSECLAGLSGLVRAVQSELVQDHMRSLIQQKSMSVDLAFYDSPDFYDSLHRARLEAGYRPNLLLESLGGLVQNGITLLAMLGVLLPFGFWLPIALVLSTLPALFIVIRHTVRRHEWQLRTTGDDRRSAYHDFLLTGEEEAAELRTFGLGPYFQQAFQTIRRRLRMERLELERSETLGQLGAALAGLSITGAAMAWMVWQTLQGRATLGSLALFYQAFNQGQRMMRTLLDNARQIYSNVLFLENLFEFFALETKVMDPPNPRPLPSVLRQGLKLEHVTFRYPDCERPSLQDFNLTIPAGKLTALVGPNGAGKSTLIKLLCRFYDPEEGRITLDDVDLREFALEKLRRSQTVLFQEPVHYYHSVRENIGFGDLALSADSDAVMEAAKAAGADGIGLQLPQGFETLLGKWFGGKELSVGEWQRIALARAFLRRAAMIFLDEPTSSLDPWAEADWVRRFRELAAGRTALIITHRFSTAMQADVINLMEDGRVVETGSHEALLALNGRYAKGWRLQLETRHAGTDTQHNGQIERTPTLKSIP